MERIGYSDLLSTTEDMLISSLMENPIGKSDPSLEMLEFKNIMQPFRTESEETFGSWLTNGEFHSSTTGLRAQQAPMRRYDIVQGSEVSMAPRALNNVTGQAGTLGSLLRMLACTPEHEKLDSKVDKETFQVGLFGTLSQEGHLATIKKPFEFSMGGLLTESICTKVSQETMQDESSPALSGGLEFYDGNGQLRNAYTNYSISKKHGQDDTLDNESMTKGDPTKKRRIERSRKMAEAKGRNLIPLSSDMQTILKRCENLEKEIRSLKLNLSFMNRKDSEQSKQIEELQKQNEELAEEKEHLMVELEQIILVSRNR
ncbi:hypothetical protein HPP92_025667 [Vanilla planifolia]|uniref:Uncharacterized protein n=1 Tax=Vanilla planifolia TaxID=51239 RepID=A0A835PKJ4_VANPL|nr:hypothetical protein HPP92_025667 [Vanilla planifolia]